MSRRGHILALMLVVLAMISASVVVFANRFSVDIHARSRDAVRSQALWLARSAMHTDQEEGVQAVHTMQGQATVVVTDAFVQVVLEDVTVTITESPWTERITWR